MQNAKRSVRRRLALAVLCLLVLAWLWGWVQPRRVQKSDLIASGMVQSVRLAGGAYGLATEGPGMNLRAGTYRLQWQAEADAENEIRLVSDNGVDIVPPRFTVGGAAGNAGEIAFTVYNETDNFRIEADYQAGDSLQVTALTLYAPACTDSLMTVSFVLVLVMLLLLFGEKIAPAERQPILAVLVFAAVMASVPCLKDNLNLGDDMNFHLERLSNLTQGLRSGQFPVRLGTYMNHGYGAVTSVFYPELFLYFPALLILAGTSIQYAMHALLIRINVLTAFAAFRLGTRLFSDEHAGAVTSALYTLAIYRLTDLYTRSALGEALAMAFLPLFALELWETLSGDRKRWPCLALAAAALAHCHLVTTAVAGCVSLLLFVIFLPKLVREKRIVSVFAAVLCAGMLCLCLAAPMLTYFRQGIATEVLQKNLAGNAMPPAQLLSQTGYDLGNKLADGTLRSRGYEIGLSLLTAVVACLALLLVRRADGAVMCGKDKLAALALVLGACCAAAASRLFPWNALPGVLKEAASFLQFPWRLLMVTDVCFALCGGWAAGTLMRSGSLAEGNPAQMKRAFACVAVTAFCLSCVMPMLTAETRKGKYVYYGRVSEQGMIFLDYSLKETDSRVTGNREVLTEHGAKAENLVRAGTRIQMEIEAEAADTLTMPLFAFTGWQAELNGSRLETGRDALNRLTVAIPAGARGTLRLFFSQKRIWRAADLLSAVTLLALLALRWKESRRKHHGRA